MTIVWVGIPEDDDGEAVTMIDKRNEEGWERETLTDGIFFCIFSRRGGRRYSKQNVRKSNSRCDGLKTS